MTTLGFFSMPSAIMSTTSIALRLRFTHKARNLISGAPQHKAGNDGSAYR